MYKKMNVEKRIKAEDINYDDKIRRFKIELARRIYKIVSGKTIM